MEKQPESAAAKGMGGAQSGPGDPPYGAGLNLEAGMQQAVTAAQEKVGLFGEVAWLMMMSTPHKHFFVSDLEWLVLPAIQTSQFRVWRNGGMPMAYASWAFLDERAEARLRDSIKKLAPGDWKSGDSLWLIDLLAPFGGNDDMVKELRRDLFPDRTMKSLQPAPGGGVAVVEW